MDLNSGRQKTDGAGELFHLGSLRVPFKLVETGKYRNRFGIISSDRGLCAVNNDHLLVATVMITWVYPARKNHKRDNDIGLSLLHRPPWDLSAAIRSGTF